jgi:hypothetical protein
VALATVWNPVAPPEHVHESEDHGAMQHLVHRHVQAHFEARSHREEHDGLVIDHHDERVLTLDSGVPLPSPIATFKPVIAAAVLLAPPAIPTLHRTRDDLDQLIHSPPRAPTGLRAPPLLSRL